MSPRWFNLEMIIWKLWPYLFFWTAHNFANGPHFVAFCCFPYFHLPVKYFVLLTSFPISVHVQSWPFLASLPRYTLWIAMWWKGIELGGRGRTSNFETYPAGYKTMCTLFATGTLYRKSDVRVPFLNFSDCGQSTANLSDLISVVIWIWSFHVWVSSRGESPGVLVTFRFLVLPVFIFSDFFCINYSLT